jgi:6-phosphogluconolactonase
VVSFAVDAVTGALIPTGSSLAASMSPFNSVVDPSGSFVIFATSRLPFNVYSASVDSVTGTLSEAAVVSTGTTPRAVEMHPSGRFVYATNIGGHQIVPHWLDASTGALTPMTPVPISSPRSMVFDKTGHHLYVSSYTIPALVGSIVHYDVNPSRGTLTQVSQTPTGGQQTFAVRRSPDGNFLYAIDVTSNSIEAFRIDSSTGDLTLIDEQPTGSGPVALAVVERTVALP